MTSFQNCRTLETRCEQCQKAKEKGHTELTTITAATATASSIHQDALNTQFKIGKCGHNNLPANCSPDRKKSYNCREKNHFTGLYENQGASPEGRM